MRNKKKRKIMSSRLFNIFWIGFQCGRDMDILNDGKLGEIDFAIQYYKILKKDFRYEEI